LFNNQSYNFDRTPSGEFPLLESNIRNVDNSIITLQADYIHPLANEGKLEAGYKSIIREIDNDLIFENFDNQSQYWAFNDTLSNRFLYQEQVHSLYANYGANIGKFGYQLGTRLEQTMMNPVQRSVEGNFRRNYLGFFPSVFLAYKLKGEQQFQLNYSRRINRPNLRELNPFINYSDPLNIRFGNPYLTPEYTNSYEVSYLTGFKGIFLTSSAYYRRTNDIIQRIIAVDTNNIATTTFQNLDSRESYGFEFIAKTTLNKWWSMTTNFNFFRTQVLGNSLQTNFNNANTSWSVMLISTMDIPKIAQVQINGNYRGPVATPQGIMREMYGINVGIKRDILKGNGSVSLNVTDIFNTREFNMITSDETFTQRFGRKRETRVATLTFSYKFGKLIDADKRKRGGRDNQNQSQDMDEDSF
jgi:outer membrane receptor protein involved in Fe transport